MIVFSRKTAAVIYSVVILMMIYGTFYDAPVSAALYSAENPYGIFIAGFAHVPCMFLGAGCIGLFLRAYSHAGRNQKILLRLLTAMCSIGCAAVFALIFLNVPWRYSCIPAVLLAAAACLFAGFVRKSIPFDDPDRLIRTGVFLAAAAAAEIMLIWMIKIPWGRPRWRTVTAVGGLEFRPWYLPSLTLKTPYLRSGIGADEFMSFPSGHTGNASAALLTVVLGELIPSFRKKRNVILGAALVWIVMVMLGRIVAGAHYVTDTAAGLCISYSAFLVLKLLYCRRFPDDFG